MKSNIQTDIGEWWLPNKLNHKVAGIIIVDEEGIKLKLDSSFENEDVVKDSIRQYPVICGLTEKNNKITLLNCILFESSKTVLSEEGDYRIKLRDSFKVEIVLTGGNFTKPEQLKYTQITLRLEGLYDWLGISGFEKDNYDLEKGFFQICYKRPETIKIKINDFIFFLYVKIINPSIQFGRVRYKEEDAYLSVTSDNPKTLEEWDCEIIKPIVSFLSLAIQRNVNIQEIILMGKKNNNGIDDIVFTNAVLNKMENKGHAKINRQLILFTYNDVNCNIDKILSNWLSIFSDLERIINLFFSSHFNDNLNTQNKFVNFVQSIEGYHRKRFNTKLELQHKHDERVQEIIRAVPQKHIQWLKGKLNHSNEPSLLMRLRETIEKLGDRYIINNCYWSDKELMLRKIRDTRNYFAHPSKRLEKNKANDDELYSLTNILAIIIQACLIDELNYDGYNVDVAFSNNHFKMLCAFPTLLHKKHF